MTAGRIIITALTIVIVGVLGLLSRLAWMATDSRTGMTGVMVPSSPAAPRASIQEDAEEVLEIASTRAEDTAPDDLEAKLAELNASAALVPNELVLTFKSPEALAAFRTRAGLEGLRIVHSDERLLSARVRYASPEAMARELREHAGEYENIGLNYLAWVPGLPNVPAKDTANLGGSEAYGNSGLSTIGAAADRRIWGRGITVAVLDTGVTDHPTLADVHVTHHDLIKDGQELDGHGTAMASLIAGNDAENGGVALASQVLDVRVADAQGESNTALLAEGIMLAIDRGARVINISLGTTGDAAVLRRAIEYALSRGVVVVAAAGNEQQTSLAFPAGYAGVISVGAVDAAGVQAYFSNSGATLALVAPGVGIVSAYSGDRMVIGSGTSQATALTTGVVAALLGWGYQPQNITTILAKAARPIGAPKEQVGAGLLQVPKR